MIKRTTTSLAAFLLVLIAGCATDAVSLSESKEIPINRYANNELTNPQDKTGLVPVFFKRDVGMMAGGCDVHVLIGNKEVFFLEQGEFGKVVLKPDVYTITASITSPLMSSSNDRSFQAYVTEKGPNIFRFGLDANGLILFSSDIQ